MDSHTPEALQRLGEYVRRRRMELKLSQPDIAARGGPSVSVLSKIETGSRRYGDRVIIKLEDTLGWERGSVQAILDGGEPALKVRPSVSGDYPDFVGEDPFFRYVWDYDGSDVDPEELRYVILRATLRRMELGRPARAESGAPGERRADQG